MKALYQTYSDGKVVLARVPTTGISGRNLLVANRASAISIGTERSVLEMGRLSLAEKLKARPDLFKRAIETLSAWVEFLKCRMPDRVRRERIIEQDTAPGLEKFNFDNIAREWVHTLVNVFRAPSRPTIALSE